MVFWYQNCSDLPWEKIVLVIEKPFEIWGWRPRICKFFRSLEQFIQTVNSLTRKPRYSSFFSALCTDFKNVLFEKKILILLRGRWGQEVVMRSFSRLLRPNFGFHLVLTSFYLEFSSFWIWGCLTSATSMASKMAHANILIKASNQCKFSKD